MSDNFDNQAHLWDQKPMHVERAKAVADQLLKQAAQSSDCTALEFGCGTGLLGFTLLPHLGHLTFCDISQPMLYQVEQKISFLNITNATTLQADLTQAPIEGKKYDLIFSLMTLHHIADLDSTIKNLTTMLSDCGTLCIADLDEDDGSYHKNSFTEHNGINRDMLRRLFSEQGLKQIEVSVPFIIKRENELRRYPVFLMTGK